MNPGKKFLTILISPSGGGKSTILKELMKKRNDLHYSVSYTTRSLREGEVNGIHYHFISCKEFKRKIEAEDFIEYANVHNNYYGTSKKEISTAYNENKYAILDIDVQGAEKILKSDIDAVTIFILPPSFKNLQNRLKSRQTETKAEFETRISNAKKEVEKFNLFDYLVINDTLEHAIDEINSIIDSEKLKTHRYKNIKEKFFQITENK